MGVDLNKALVRRFYEEVWARGHLGLMNQFGASVFAGGTVKEPTDRA